MSQDDPKDSNDPLSRELRNRFLGFAAPVLIRAWFGTLRCRSSVLGRRGAAWPADLPCIIAGWHDTLLIPVWFTAPRRPYALVSRSGDGEWIARVGSGLGMRPIRGSSSRGGAAALRAILRIARRTESFQLAVAVDGPRGPRHECKPGVVYLASRLGLPIAPVGAFAERGWRAKSWDRFLAPAPFSRAAVVIDELLSIPGGLDDDGVQRYCRIVEDAIHRAAASAEALARGSPRDGDRRFVANRAA
jgi:lysophospholipid acyltransferase (LPLAT)-like uncharacterized protein